MSDVFEDRLTSLAKHGCSTKRAPDAGDSAHTSSSFLRLVIFLAGRLRCPLPSAGTHRASRKPLGCLVQNIKSLE